MKPPDGALGPLCSPSCPLNAHMPPPASLVTPRLQTPRAGQLQPYRISPAMTVFYPWGWWLWHTSKVCTMAQVPPAPVKRWGQDTFPSFASMVSGAIVSLDTNVLAQDCPCEGQENGCWHHHWVRVVSEWQNQPDVGRCLELPPLTFSIWKWHLILGLGEFTVCLWWKKKSLHHMLLLFFTVSGNWWRLRYCSFCVFGFCDGQYLQCTVMYHWDFIKKKGAVERAPVISKRRMWTFSVFSCLILRQLRLHLLWGMKCFSLLMIK